MPLFKYTIIFPDNKIFQTFFLYFGFKVVYLYQKER